MNATPPPCLRVAWAGGRDGRLRSAGRERLRCASLLKPLYLWVLDAACEERSSPVVVRSDNELTDRLVAASGGLPALIGALEARSGVRFEAGATWGRLVIGALETARAYLALAQAADCGDGQAIRAVELMRAVPSEQRLGIGLRPGRAPLPTKLGWDLSPDEDLVRTHAVCLDESGGVAVVLTALPCGPALRRRWEELLAREGPTGVLALHEELAGAALRGAMRRALAAAERG